MKSLVGKVKTLLRDFALSESLQPTTIHISHLDFSNVRFRNRVQKLLNKQGKLSYLVIFNNACEMLNVIVFSEYRIWQNLIFIYFAHPRRK